MRRWNRWISNLQWRQTVTVPRCVISLPKVTLSLHGFSDASSQAVCAAVYITSVSNNETATSTQNLLVAKSRVPQRNTSIPRLELVAALTLAKLVNHVLDTLHTQTVAECHLWIDSMTVMHWLTNKGRCSRIEDGEESSSKDLRIG